MWARLLADLIVILHFMYVSFVVFGLAAIVGGLAFHRAWARNFWLRSVHLAMIGIVVVEAWVGIVCPLTTLENALRRTAGQEPYPLHFIEYWMHRIMFMRLPAWVFMLGYTAFGLVVLLTFVLGPPRSPHRKAAGS